MGVLEMRDVTILLTEDNPDDEALVLRVLKKGNLANEIVVARDGPEALDYLFGTGQYAGRDPQENPTLVLLDLKLPKMNGLEVLQRIRADERTKHTPVVVLTSSDEQKDVAACYDSGCNSYVQKPVEFSEFAEAVRQLHLYWLAIHARPHICTAGGS
jgi:two-component system response regulator